MDINNKTDYMMAWYQWWEGQPTDKLDSMKAKIIERYYPDGWNGFVQDAEKNQIKHENSGI